jgi:putative ABC transport system permease protein
VSPVVVASLARLGPLVRGGGRVAVRSVVRSRASSAAVVMALIAINAGAIAISTAFASSTTQSVNGAAFMPDNALIVTRTIPSETQRVGSYLPIPASVERTLRTILPKATWDERRAVLDTVVKGGGGESRLVQNGKIVAVVDTLEMVVADPPILHLVGLSSADNATLQRVGAIVLGSPDDPQAHSRAPVTVQVGQGADAPTLTAARTKDSIRATAASSILITPAKARALRLSIVPAGEIVTNPTALNESQRASIDALLPSLVFGPKGQFDPNAPMLDVLWTGPRSREISPNTVRQILLAIVIVIALIVLAMSLALSAAETRDERDVLVALGARPRTMRTVAAWKAGLLAFIGAAIAVPTGFIPVAFVFAASVRTGDRAHLVFPWTTALELVIVAPIIAAVIAAIGSGIAQRVRPTQMSTFAAD